MKNKALAGLLSSLILFSVSTNVSARNIGVGLSKATVKKAVDYINKRDKIPKAVLSLRCSCTGSSELALFLYYLKGKKLTYKQINEGYMITTVFKDEMTDKTNKLVVLFSKPQKLFALIDGWYTGTKIDRIVYNGVEGSQNDIDTFSAAILTTLVSSNLDEINRENPPDTSTGNKSKDYASLSAPSGTYKPTMPGETDAVNKQLSEAIFGKQNTQTTSSSSNPSIGLAKDIITKITNNDFESIRANFGGKMLNYSAEQIKEIWNEDVKGCGAFKNQEEPIPSFNSMTIKCNFENGSRNVRFVFNDLGKVTALSITQ